MKSATQRRGDDPLTAAGWQRLWTLQLHREFAEICQRYQITLSAPVFSLHAGLSRLGYWDAVNRRISISQKLIEDYGWEETQLVLRHEMAHQICDELYGGDEAGHAGLFLRACQLLDLPERYRRARLDMGMVAEKGSSGANSDHWQRLFARIRKMLALAGSDNSHEAAVAMAKAQQLLQQHHLSVGQLTAPEDIIYRSIPMTTSRISDQDRRIAALLSRFFAVRIVQSRLYQPWLDQQLPVLEVFGRPAAVDFAVHGYHFLKERLTSLWAVEKVRQVPGHGLAKRNSFQLGILAGFAAVLEEQGHRRQKAAPAADVSAGTMLAVADIGAIEQRIQRRYPRLSQRRLSGRQVHRSLYEQGLGLGKALRLHQVLEKSSQQKGIARVGDSRE